jgi:hypothetical protein
MQKLTAKKFHGVPPGDTKTIPIPVPLKGSTISGLKYRGLRFSIGQSLFVRHRFFVGKAMVQH